MKLNRLLALALSLGMVVSTLPANAALAAELPSGETVESQKLEITELDGSDIDVDLTRDTETSSVDLAETIDPEEAVRVIIVMEGDSVIEADSYAVLDDETQAQISDLEGAQADVISEIEDTVLDGEALDVSYSYTWLLNGVAATVPYGTIEAIEALDGVRDVLIQQVYTVCETETTSDISYPMTVSDGVMIGRESTWANGYTGEGMKIAIVDTGLDTDHPNFAALPEDKLTEDSATPETIASVLPNLNASNSYSGLTVNNVYLSSKVAYAFNYSDDNLKVNHAYDTQGDHGTHVAGIAAANKVEGSDVVGVAPDAQLYIMKVFGNDEKSATTEVILAALEDALLLGADVVNMSLGSPAGFTSDGDKIDEIYNRVSTTGTILAISAGNSYTMGYGNAWGTNENLTSNPDNAVIASPGTYQNVLSVASVENAYYMSNYLTANGYNIGYADGSYGSNAPLSALAGQEFQIVAVPGVGEESDYADLDVEGKIALVQRGNISFVDKCQNAENAGAVACLVYNNISGTIGMDLTDCTATIPCASITMADGAYLLGALEENPALTVTIGEGATLIASETAYQMSDFSSWGVAPDLSLEPDITAPGGNIYSTLDGGTYGLMSGTSMASPNVAGISALTVQYVKEIYGYTGEQLHSFVKALLMSTSSPLTYSDGLYYSPRSQGSGLANAYGAVTTQAYLSVDGCDTPKAELGDDPARTGSYSFRFDVNNFGDRDLYYDLGTVAQTEGVDETYADYGYLFMSSTPVALDASTGERSASMVLTYDVNDDAVAGSHDAYLIYQAAVVGKPADENWTDVSFRYNTDGNETVDADDVQAYLDALVGLDSPADLTDEVLQVKAGKSATVSVSVDLTDSDKAYFDTYYENGCYVEGFTFLTALNNGGVDLSLPYLAFYGGWDEAPVIDSGIYWGDEDLSYIEYNQYPNILWTQFYYSASWIPGLNPYLEEAFDESHISLSPNGDSYADYIDDIYVSLLRNAAELSFTYTGEDGTVYFEELFEHVRKSYYYEAYGGCIPFVYSWYSYAYDLTDENGDALPNNTKLTLDIAATIDYEGAEPDVWSIPFTVDTEAPELLDAQVLQDEDAGTYELELTFRDNLSVAAVSFLNSSGSVIYDQYLAPDEEATVDEEGNLVWTARYDVTGLGDHFVVVLGDYAFNESYYSVSAPGNDIAVDTSMLYGYRVADNEIYDDSLYGWIGMEIVTDEDSGETAVDTQAYSSEYYMDYAVTAAEQVGGKIIAVDANKSLVWIEPGYWDERNPIANLDVGIRELCYDPVNETLYGLTSGSYAYLVTIDIETAELNYVGSSYLYSAVALTCDEEGNLYGIYGSYYGSQLRAIDKETGAWGDTLIDSSAALPYAYYAQSMTYKDGVFYWAAYQYSWYGSEGTLYAIAQDEEGTWNAQALGTIAGNAEVVGLLWLDTNEYDWPDTELEAITMDPASASLLVGGSTTLTALQTPWYGGAEISWSSSDEAIATVDNSGRVTGVSVGTATITASAGDVSGTATVYVVNPQSTLNGFVISNMDYTIYSQWITFPANAPAKYETLTEPDMVTFTAAEYVNGTLYAYSETTDFYSVDPTDYSYTKIASAESQDYQIIDMAYDYTTGNLYGLATNYYETYLVTIDTLSGRFQIVDLLTDDYYDVAVGIAVDNEGVVYYICDGYGFLCTYDPAEYETTVIGLTGYIPYGYIQSMTFDHDTGELYWAAFTSSSFGVMYIDLHTGKALELGAVDGGAEISCLYTVPVNPPETPYVDVESVELLKDSVVLVEGGTTTAPVEVLPYNATDRSITWTVEDESVATIENGTISAVSVGTTTATGTLGDFTVTLEITVIESAGAFRSYVSYDFLYGTSGYWCELYDYDIHTPGEADFQFWADYEVYAAAYYDGYVYCYGEDFYNYDTDTAIHLQKMDAETGEVVADYTGYDYYVAMMDMTFDYSEGAMYIVGNTKNTQDNSTLYTIDLSNGKLYTVAALDDYFLTLACSEDGQLYGVSYGGILYAIDKVTGALTAIGDTGYEVSGYQSMAFDYDSDRLYWAQTNYVTSWWGDGVMEANFLQVDPTDASVINLGETKAMLVGLYFPTEREPVVPDEVQATSLSVNTSSLVLNAGERQQLTVMLLPVSIREVTGEITYASSDTSIATVEADGTVTAVAAGTAEITVTCGDMSVVCTVHVLDESTLLYVVNENGWEATPLLDPTAEPETAELAEELGLTISGAAYDTDEGYVYAVDEEGYLWKMTLDLGTVEQIGETSLLAQMEEYDYLNPVFVDVAYNPYAGGLYVMVGDYYYNEYYDYGYLDGYYVYEVDMETAEVEMVGLLSYSFNTAIAFTFNSADTILVYDYFNDYVYQVPLYSFYDEPKAVLWAQQCMTANEDAFDMIFSKELNRLFIVTADWFYGNGSQALYMFNPDDGSFGMVSEGSWTQNVKSLLLVEGAEPVTSEPEVPEEAETPVVTESAEPEVPEVTELAEPEVPEVTEPAAEPEVPEVTEPAADPEVPEEGEPAAPVESEEPADPED